MKAAVLEKWRGVYINPDDIEDAAHQRGFFDMESFSVRATGEEIFQFFRAHPLLHNSGFVPSVDGLSFSDGKLFFNEVIPNSYFAAVAADFLREKLLEKRADFTFETVMSSASKVRLLEKAQRLGYRTYLYYIATQDPEINVLRVANRVRLGGHDVPEDKIRARYHRSLDLLWDAIRHTDRAYIFDNTESSPNPQAVWLAEITGGALLELKAERMPFWFKRAILDKTANPF